MSDIDRIKEMVYQAVFAILDDEEGITGLAAGGMATACEAVVGGRLEGKLGVRTPLMYANLKELGRLTELLGTEAP